MDIERARLICLSLRGVSEEMPFGEEWIVFRVEGKIFACLHLLRPDRIVLKCAPEFTSALRARHNHVLPAWHFNKRHWIEALFDLNARLVERLVRHAYAAVLHGLPKKQQLDFFGRGLPTDVFFLHRNVVSTTMDPARELGQRLCGTEGTEYVLVHSDLQRAGRGQQGTHWESANGRNLTFTLAVAPDFLPAARWFALSQISALAVCRAVAPLLDEADGELAVKWPNDIYFGNRKLSGMLIANTVAAGRLRLSCIGIGINVNQAVWESDAPNPVSIAQVIGREANRFLILERFVEAFRELYEALRAGGEDEIRAAYSARLFRRSGMHPFRDRTVQSASESPSFYASIEAVDPDGTLVLRRADGTLRRYAFKEVEFVLQ